MNNIDFGDLAFATGKWVAIGGFTFGAVVGLTSPISVPILVAYYTKPSNAKE